LATHGSAANAAIPIILELLLKDSDSSFQRDAVAALNSMGRYRGLPASTLKLILQSENEFALMYGLDSIIRERTLDSALLPYLIKGFSDHRPGIRERAARCCLSDSPGIRSQALPKLAKLLDDQDIEVRNAALASLESKRPFGSTDLSLFRDLVKSMIPETRKWAVEESSRLVKSEIDAIAIFSPLIQDSNDEVILAVLYRLSMLCISDQILSLSVLCSIALLRFREQLQLLSTCRILHNQKMTNPYANVLSH
jgi:hypothetical protein